MCTQVEMDLIRQEAGMWMQRGKSFTSVDIANALKQRKQWIRNKDVASFLRNTAVGMALQYSLTPYKVSVINVQLPNGKWTEASLYHPENIDPDSYKNIKQKALSPDEAEEDNPFSPSSGLKVTINPTEEKKSASDTIKQLGIDVAKFNDKYRPPKGDLAEDLEFPNTIKMEPGFARLDSGRIVLNIEYVEHLHIHLNE